MLTVLSFSFKAGLLTLEKRDSIYITKLLDSVYIYNDTMKIRGRYGTFIEDSNLLFLGGGVGVLTHNISAKSDSLILRENGSIIIFIGKSEIVKNKEDTLRAEKIRVIKDTLYAESKVSGNIKSSDIVFYADTFYSYDSVYIFLGKDVRVFTGMKDTVKFFGTYLKVFKDTVMSDRPSRIETGKYTIKGDTFFYNRHDSLGSFLGNVLVSWDSGMSSGDTAFFYLKNGHIDSMLLFGNCYLKTNGKDNRFELSASMFKAFFIRDSLRELIARKSRGVLVEEKKNE